MRLNRRLKAQLNSDLSSRASFPELLSQPREAVTCFGVRTELTAQTPSCLARPGSPLTLLRCPFTFHTQGHAYPLPCPSSLCSPGQKPPRELRVGKRARWAEAHGDTRDFLLSRLAAELTGCLRAGEPPAVRKPRLLWVGSSDWS